MGRRRRKAALISKKQPDCYAETERHCFAKLTRFCLNCPIFGFENEISCETEKHLICLSHFVSRPASFSNVAHVTASPRKSASSPAKPKACRSIAYQGWSMVSKIELRRAGSGLQQRPSRDRSS